MKKYVKYGIFFLISILIYVVDVSAENVFSLIILPYSILGDAIRYLSITSPVLNVVASIIYISVSLIPIGISYYLFRAHRFNCLKFTLLVVLSLFLFVTIYYFINPHLLYQYLNELYFTPNLDIDYKFVQSIILTGIAYISYLIILIYLIVMIKQSQTYNAKRFFSILIDTLIFIYIISFVLVDMKSFIDSMSMNTGVFAVNILTFLQFIAKLIVKALTIILLNHLQKFALELSKEEIDSNILKITNKIYSISFVLIIITLLAQIIINGWQLLFLSEFTNLSFELELPILSIIIAVISFLFTKYFRKVNDLSEDHSMII